MKGLEREKSLSDKGAQREKWSISFKEVWKDEDSREKKGGRSKNEDGKGLENVAQGKEVNKSKSSLREGSILGRW